MEKITSQFPPYSDFNFTSMWCWNTQEKMKLSMLNENLVVLFYDYVTEQPFLSFIGKNKTNETASALIDYSEQNFKTASLKLVPEDTAKQLSHHFLVTPDEDAHDYIIPVAYLATLPEYPVNSHHAARYCRSFMKNNPKNKIKIQNISEVNGLIEVFKNWSHSKNLNHAELNEYKAFERLLQNHVSENFILSIFNDEKIIGFITLENISSDYSVCHFTKANSDYNGVYDMLMYLSGKHLQERGIKYFNFEQDLGIPNLRKAKRKYKPAFYLKKFIIGVKK